MILYLTHGNGEESIPLELPAASSQVEEIDIRLDDICSGEENFRISDVKSSVKGLWQFIRSADLLDPEDLEKLNRLSRQLDAMSEKERQIFAGALLSECIRPHGRRCPLPCGGGSRPRQRTPRAGPDTPP